MSDSEYEETEYLVFGDFKNHVQVLQTQYWHPTTTLNN